MDEFALIRSWFADLAPDGECIALGIGDDCALLDPPLGEQLAITTDTLIAGRHFPADTAAQDIGWKALAVNLSDLAAVGARPCAFVLALSLPVADQTWLDGFARGLRACAQAGSIALIGGDTTCGALSITITALGTLPAGSALRRSGARAGDLVCITGTLGDAGLALQAWRAGSPVDGEDQRWLRARLDRPTPRNAAGMALRGIASAAIDLSDGLFGDLAHVCTASGVGAELRLDALPASAPFRQLAPAADRAALQLAAGDDYELCVCVAADRFGEAQRACGPLPLTAVGRIVAGAGVRLYDAVGAIVELPIDAYRHF